MLLEYLYCIFSDAPDDSSHTSMQGNGPLPPRELPFAGMRRQTRAQKPDLAAQELIQIMETPPTHPQNAFNLRVAWR
jgi:hypothetical protein